MLFVSSRLASISARFAMTLSIFMLKFSPFLEANKSTALMFLLLNKMPIAVENFAFAMQNSIILIKEQKA